MNRERRPGGRANPRFAQADMPEPVVRLIGRLFFGTGTGIGLLSALLFVALPDTLATPVRAALVATYLGFAAACALAWRRSTLPGIRLDPLLFAVALLS